MSDQPPSLLDRLPVTWKAVLSIAGAIGVSFAGGVSLTAWSQLPGRVANNEAWLTDNTHRIEVLEEGLQVVVREMRLSNCIEIAKLEDDDWGECVRKYSRNDLLVGP